MLKEIEDNARQAMVGMDKVNAYQHKAQYYETDQMGCVHHSNYIRWFEEARTDLLEQLGFSYGHMEELGILCPVLEVHVEYKDLIQFGMFIIALLTFVYLICH